MQIEKNINNIRILGCTDQSKRHHNSFIEFCITVPVSPILHLTCKDFNAIVTADFESCNERTSLTKYPLIKTDNLKGQW